MATVLGIGGRMAVAAEMAAVLAELAAEMAVAAPNGSSISKISSRNGSSN